MPRKTASDLDMTPLAIAERHVTTCEKKLDRLWSQIDKLLDKSGDNLRKGVTMKQYESKLDEHAHAVNELYRAVDNLMWQRRHKDDPPTEPPVPEEDVRAVLIASLDDKTDELRFTVNNGLLASAIAKAIRLDVTEEDVEAPLCKDHR